MTPTYQLIRRAMLESKQLVLTYKDYRREVCPHVIGRKNGFEQVLTYQFGGGSSSGLPAGGQWRCMRIRDILDVSARAGEWHSDPKHSRTQTCVDQVDLELWVGADGMPYVKRA